MQHSNDLVVKVNEIFHDLESEYYEEAHPEIFLLEKKYWEKIGEKYIKNKKRSIKILDAGAGTGFVGLALGKFLKKADEFVCVDVSNKILDKARENIQRKDFSCGFRFVKIDGDKFDFEDNFFDMLTINAVLHHIPEVKKFLKEVNRILKPGGIIVIAHEPNLEYYKCRIKKYLFNPKLVIKNIFKALKLYNFLSNKINRSSKFRIRHQKTILSVNDKLIKQNLIKEPLSSGEISNIVDAYAPSEFNNFKGAFSIEKLMSENFKNYILLEKRIYNHLGKTSNSNFITKCLNKLFEKLSPDSGSELSFVLKKK